MTGGCCRYRCGNLADIHGEVSDALHVGADPGRRHECSEIERDRLMQGDEGEAAIVDFHLEIVDAGIAGNDVSQQLGVALDKAAHGSAQMIFR